MNVFPLVLSQCSHYTSNDTTFCYSPMSAPAPSEVGMLNWEEGWCYCSLFLLSTLLLFTFLCLQESSCTTVLGSFALQSHCVWGLTRLSVPSYCRSLAEKTSFIQCQESARCLFPRCRLSECSLASYHTGFSKQCPPVDIIPHSGTSNSQAAHLPLNYTFWPALPDV